MSEPSKRSFSESDFESLSRRVVLLEEMICHDERTIGQLNEVVVNLNGQLEQVNKRLHSIEARFQWVADNAGDLENLPHDRPPHY